MEDDIRLLAGRHPDILAPFRDASLMGRADAVLTLWERSEPESALIIAVGGLEATALGGLQSDSRPGDSLAVRPQDLACNAAPRSDQSTVSAQNDVCLNGINPAGGLITAWMLPSKAMAYWSSP